MLLLCACGHECSLKKLVKPSLRKKYNKNTYRYFSKHQLVSRWLPPREQTLPATLCLFKYAPRGCCRKYFKQKVQQLAAEKAEIFNWKCIWKTSKSPMQRVKVVNVLWYTYTYHIGVFNIQQNTEQSHKYTIYQQLTTYPWIIFKRQYCNFLPAIDCSLFYSEVVSCFSWGFLQKQFCLDFDILFTIYVRNLCPTGVNN